MLGDTLLSLLIFATLPIDIFAIPYDFEIIRSEPIAVFHDGEKVLNRPSANSEEPTNQNEPEIVSAPGCPEPAEFDRVLTPWVKYPKNGRCYRVHSEGPCPPEMLFFINANNPSEGYCDCKCFKTEAFFESETICHDCRLTFSKHQRDGRCYALNLDQGPCNSGEWLVYRNNTFTSTLACEPRKCPEGEGLVETYTGGTECEPMGRGGTCAGMMGGGNRLQCKTNQFYSYIQRRCVPKMARFTKGHKLFG